MLRQLLFLALTTAVLASRLEAVKEQHNGLRGLSLGEEEMEKLEKSDATMGSESDDDMPFSVVDSVKILSDGEEYYIEKIFNNSRH